MAVPKEEKDQKNYENITKAFYKKHVDGLAINNSYLAAKGIADVNTKGAKMAVQGQTATENARKRHIANRLKLLGQSGDPDVDKNGRLVGTPGEGVEEAEAEEEEENAENTAAAEEENQEAENQEIDESGGNPEAETEGNGLTEQPGSDKNLERYQNQDQQERAAKQSQQPKDGNQTPGEAAQKDPYAKQGGVAPQAQRKQAQDKAAEQYQQQKADQKEAKQEENAARRAKQLASGEEKEGLALRAANGIGKAGEALAGAGKAAGSAVMTGLRALGTLYVNPATAPWAWGITTAVLCIVLLLVSAGGLYGASAGSPNAAGKSMSEPVLATDPILSQIVNASNIADVQTLMQNNKQVILDALQKINTQLDTGKFDAISSAQTRAKIQEIQQILSQVSADNATQNANLAPQLQTKAKELLAIWGPAVSPVKGTALPISESAVTKFGDDSDNHGSTRIRPENVDGHNSFFGSAEKGSNKNDDDASKQKCTADAIDLGAPVGTPIMAPFTGDYTYTPINKDPNKKVLNQDMMILRGSADSHQMVAVLAHLDPVNGALTGHVTVGQQIGQLHAMGTSGSHLHFELKVDGKDVSRTSTSQTNKDLWTMMKTILSGGK
jgi:murein DD-endopeptidase MepM/ murein hydrolase activator NlpD